MPETLWNRYKSILLIMEMILEKKIIGKFYYFLKKARENRNSGGPSRLHEAKKARKSNDPSGARGGGGVMQ